VPDETAGRLEIRLAELGSRVLVRTLEGIEAGSVAPVPQPSAGATHAPRFRSEDGKLNPTTMTAVEIDRRVRALSERLGAWITLMGVDLKVLGGHVDGDTRDGIAVPTADGVYVVEEVQPPGGRRMSAAAWARGRR
jgi:methionyl-tRNA formyltransferase